jgi:hypothetical protein
VTRNQLKLLCPLVATLAFGWANPAKADIMYGVTGVSGASSTLYSETYATGSTPSGGAFNSIANVTLGGNAAMPISLAGIAYDSANSTLYGVTNSNSSFAANSLVTINTTNGNATLVGGTLGGVNNVTAQSLAYDSTLNGGSLIASSKTGVGAQTNSIITINTSTGLASNLGGSSAVAGSTTGNGLAVNSLGNIYLAPFNISSPTNGAMYSVNSTTGAGTAGLGFSNVPLSGSNMKAMAFDSSGNFFGLDFAPNTQTELVQLTNTGSNWQLTDLGTTPSGSAPGTPFVGIAFAPVPEPSSFLLAGLPALGVGLWSWVRRRRAELATICSALESPQFVLHQTAYAK